jgi:hypothetical protein
LRLIVGGGEHSGSSRPAVSGCRSVPGTGGAARPAFQQRDGLHGLAATDS